MILLLSFTTLFAVRACAMCLSFSPVLATYHIRSFSQAFKSPFPYLSQLAESPMEE
jgi:hypothetical protein